MRFALQGISYCLKHELNFRLQSFAAIMVTGAGFYFGIRRNEWLIIILCCAMVLTLEMINTSIEKLADVVSPDYLPAVKTIKDISAAAVLVTSLSSLIIGVIIFFPYLKSLLHR